MNISFIEKENNRAKVRVELTKADYSEGVDKKIKSLARNMSMPGFRKGKAPVQLIRKQYGNAVRLEVIEELIRTSMAEFYKEQAVKPLFGAIPADGNDKQFLEENPVLEFTTALLPEEDLEYDLSAHTFTKYEATIGNEDIAKMKETLLEENAEVQEVEKAVEESAMFFGTLVELEGDLPKEDGLQNTNALLMMSSITNEAEKAKFREAEKGQILVLDPFNLNPENIKEVRYFLGVREEELEQYRGKEFSFEISKITDRVKATLGQEFYDKVFGPEQVKSEEELDAKLREYLERDASAMTHSAFTRDFNTFVREQVQPNIHLADEVITESYNMHRAEEEQIKDMESALRLLREELFVQHQAEKRSIEVSKEEIEQGAFYEARSQFAAMGLGGIDPKYVWDYAQKQLENSGYVSHLERALLTSKLTEKLLEELNFESKTLSYEELKKELEAKQPKAESEEQK